MEIVLILPQDRRTVCTECTEGLEIVLDEPDGTPIMWKLISVRLKMVLVSMQDRCMFCAKLTIGSEIVFDAPDGNLVTWVI
jgi:hypothetical protein